MNNLAMWEDQKQLEEIKKVCGPKLSNIEFRLFVEIGKQTKLNPFKKEIWAIKFSDKMPASIFIARDGFRIMARRNVDYKMHVADAVYENDEFGVEDGHVKHRYNLKNRGKLLGAYCKVYTRSSEEPFFTYVDLGEYNKNKGNWASMPATMIKKVAEAQCLRMAFPDDFSSVYSEAEQWNQERELKIVNDENYTPKEKELIELLAGKEEPEILGDLDAAQEKLDGLVDAMRDSTSLEELKSSFEAAYKFAKTNLPDLIEVVNSEKDRLKELI